MGLITNIFKDTSDALTKFKRSLLHIFSKELNNEIFRNILYSSITIIDFFNIVSLFDIRRRFSLVTFDYLSNEEFQIL